MLWQGSASLGMESFHFALLHSNTLAFERSGMPAFIFISPLFFFFGVVASLNDTDVIPRPPLAFLPGDTQLLYTQELCLCQGYLWSNTPKV